MATGDDDDDDDDDDDNDDDDDDDDDDSGSVFFLQCCSCVQGLGEAALTRHPSPNSQQSQPCETPQLDQFARHRPKAFNTCLARNASARCEANS